MTKIITAALSIPAKLLIDPVLLRDTLVAIAQQLGLI